MNPNQTNPAVEPEKINIDEEMESIKADMQARFGLLPEELQQAIMSNEYQMKLYDIAKKYKLTYEQLGKLEMETTLVLLGMTHPDEYGMEIQKAIKTTPEILQNVIKEVGEQVFVPIRTTLMKLYSEESETVATETAPTNTTATEPLARKVLIDSSAPIKQQQPTPTPLTQIKTESVTQTMVQNTQPTPPVMPKPEQPQARTTTGAFEAYTQARQQTPDLKPVTEQKQMQPSAMPIPQAPYKQAPQTPPVQPGPTISVAQVANKLQNTIVANPTVRTYTAPPVTNTTANTVMHSPKTQTGDLYREPIE